MCLSVFTQILKRFKQICADNYVKSNLLDLQDLREKKSLAIIKHIET
jgi:hypothetical protein